MTRKEKLLVEIYNLRNQIAEIKGNTIVNIEEFSQTRKFRDEAAEWKEYELKLRIEELKKSLEKAKVEAAQQAAADAFYATEQGQVFKRECQEKRETLAIEFDSTESATLELIESHIQAVLGKQWRAGRLSTSYVELAVVDADNKPIFGQSVSIYYEKKCWLGGELFQINVGTCGSHDLLPEERGYTMADLYIGIGKLHANTELLETIKDALFYYAERIADIQKEVRELDELIKNPTRA
ncbi:MAG: hypothetical protein IJO90_00805 [Alistipes sp.]|nr:hypothetical protein [Alistipes sp.]